MFFWVRRHVFPHNLRNLPFFFGPGPVHRQVYRPKSDAAEAPMPHEDTRWLREVELQVTHSVDAWGSTVDKRENPTGYLWWYPAWWCQVIAIEAMASEIVDFPIKHGDFPYSYVSLPEGINDWFPSLCKVF